MQNLLHPLSMLLLMPSTEGMQEFSTIPLLMVALGLFVVAVPRLGVCVVRSWEQKLTSCGMSYVEVVFGAFNIFVAQLTCAHREIYDSMVGYSILRSGAAKDESPDLNHNSARAPLCCPGGCRYR